VSPWWLLLIVPGALLTGAFIAFYGTLLWVGKGMFR
jgi:hypothetical protein